MTDVVFVLQAPAPTALADPRAILGLARMCRGGPGLGPVERISAARALWSACLAEGDGAWHVEETEGAIASLAALLATGGDESVDRESARAARVAAAGALGAVLSGATVSRDESRAVRCANAVCTADGVLAGLTELLRGARKAGTEGGGATSRGAGVTSRARLVTSRARFPPPPPSRCSRASQRWPRGWYPPKGRCRRS